jgi:hypothetical protein
MTAAPKLSGDDALEIDGLEKRRVATA